MAYARFFVFMGLADQHPLIRLDKAFFSPFFVSRQAFQYFLGADLLDILHLRIRDWRHALNYTWNKLSRSSRKSSWFRQGWAEIVWV
jgi:hypothetical protein